VTREQRLCTAVDASAQRVIAASKERDEQAIFEALGVCLMWMCALDDLLESQKSGRYKNVRDDDRQGRFVRGLRRARNAIVHGDVVVAVAESADIPNPSTLIVSSGAGSRIVGPPTRVEWTFLQTLPPPGQPQPKLEAAYGKHIAGTEVTTPIISAVSWLNRAVATP
jgi:hypothetical protein